MKRDTPEDRGPPALRGEPPLEALAARYGLDPRTVGKLRLLLKALAREADPPTTIRDPAVAADAHLADALSALALGEVRGVRTIADIGSGAGFPGLALAAALPDARVDLIEASRRKCEVIERLGREARLTGARAVPERAEAWAAGAGCAAYELVTARALGTLAVLAEYAAPLLGLGGALVAWKGRRDADEEAAAAAACAKLGMERREVRRVEPFPGARDRHLHVMVKHRETPAGFPRRPGRAAKRPLA